MPRISNIELFEAADKYTLSVRTRTSVEKLPMLITEVYSKLAKYLQELETTMADMPFVCYYNLDMQDMDVEIGFIVAKPLPAKDNIQAGVIPAGKRAVCLYRGPYSEIEPIYMEMLKWTFDKEYKTQGHVYESYYNSPEDFHESELITRIVMPIEP